MSQTAWLSQVPPFMFAWFEDKWLLSQQVLYKLVESMSAEVYDVIKVKGKHADYFDIEIHGHCSKIQLFTQTVKLMLFCNGEKIEQRILTCGLRLLDPTRHWESTWLCTTAENKIRAVWGLAEDRLESNVAEKKDVCSPNITGIAVGDLGDIITIKPENDDQEEASGGRACRSHLLYDLKITSR